MYEGKENKRNHTENQCTDKYKQRKQKKVSPSLTDVFLFYTQENSWVEYLSKNICKDGADDLIREKRKYKQDNTASL